MRRIVSGEDINGLQKHFSDVQQQHQTAETIKLATASPEHHGITYTSTSDMDEVVSLSPSSFVTDDGSTLEIVVENDGRDVHDNANGNNAMIDVINILSDSNLNLTMQQQQQQQRNIDLNASIAVSTVHLEQQQQQQAQRLSILNALFPTVGVDGGPISRNDSRNSATTFSSHGRQSSQNSSRDWGWFEDTHHSDNHGAVGLSAACVSDAIMSQQHRNVMNKINNAMVDGSLNDSGSKNDKGKIDETMRRTIDDNDGRNQNDEAKTSNEKNRRGDEMLLDNMEEYLEPILVHPRLRDIENEAAVQAVTAPNYVLEESLSDQFLWKNTAGNRPPQPVEERAFFEAMWTQNFAMSEVEYKMPVEVLTATTPVSLNPFADGNFGANSTGTGDSDYNIVTTPPIADTVVGVGGKQDVAEATLVSRLNDPSRGIHSFVVPGMSGSGQGQPHLQNQHKVVKSTSGSNGDLTIFAKGDNVFGTTVSKSFARPSVNGDLVTAVDTVNISVASYRVVESEKRGKHAQFLVIYREGSIRDTIGVWKRYSDFQELSKKVIKVHEGCAAVIANMSPLTVTEEHDVEHLPNAITSWHLLKKRKRWYRCLDPGYLSLKVFLLERFLHDILFESSSPDLLRDFVGVPPPK